MANVNYAWAHDKFARHQTEIIHELSYHMCSHTHTNTLSHIRHIIFDIVRFERMQLEACVLTAYTNPL